MCMYNIGNTTIEIKGLIKINFSSRMEMFRTYNGNINSVYNIKYVEKISRPTHCKCIYLNRQFAVINKNNRIFFFYTLEFQDYAVLVEKKTGVYNLYLDKSFFDNKIHPYIFPSLLRLEKELIIQKCLVFHSSYIAVNGRSILFTAPSGGGKSTQAELWKKYKNAEIINGDKSIIGKEGEEWNVYGIPFSGSSEYCQNKTFTLKAIVILDKGPINQLSQVGIRGFSNVFSQITVNPWDKEFCEKAMNLVIDVCNEVPVYYYSCTKTKEAVDVLYKEFIEKGILNGTV